MIFAHCPECKRTVDAHGTQYPPDGKCAEYSRCYFAHVRMFEREVERLAKLDDEQKRD